MNLNYNTTSNSITISSGHLRLREQVGVQAPVSKDDGVAKSYECSLCKIVYPVKVGTVASCPLCSAHRQIAELREALNSMRARVEHTENEFTKMRSHVDLNLAFRQALDLVGKSDLVFIRSIVDDYRNDKSSIQLKTTHGPLEKGQRKPQVNGFLAIRRGEPDAFLFESIGGAAFGNLYEEAAIEMGSASALAIAVRAVLQWGGE